MFNMKQWQLKNKGRLKEYKKEYRKNNKEKILKYQRYWTQENREKMKDYYRQYKIDNKERIAKRMEKYIQVNKEKITRYYKKWRQTPKGKAINKATCHNYRTLTKDLTIEIIQRVYEDNIKKYGTLTCYLCSKPIKFGDDSLDHSTPISRNGNNSYKNLGIAHQKCNSSKGTRTLQEWFADKEMIGN